MASDEEQEVFEITDFTTASEWERFIARLEEIIHEWKLPSFKSPCPVKSDDLINGKWEEKVEDLKFADFAFNIVHHYLKQDTPVCKDSLSDDGTEGQLPPCLTDMMCEECDFPPKVHCLVRWYGLRDFIIICPARHSEAITTEDRAKLLLSSVCIAVNNTNCHVPVFVQLHHRQRKFFLGICEGGGVRTHFEMVHLNHTPKNYNHLSGLLSLFKSKLGCPAVNDTIVNVSIRFTYALRDWSLYSWPQVPPDIDETSKNVSQELQKLPFGAIEEPIQEVYLSATWPFIREDVIIDSDVSSDLDPLLAPKWTIRVRMKPDVLCLMSEYLQQFWMLSLERNSTEQLCERIPEHDELDSHPDFSHALDKLAGPVGNVTLPSLSSVVNRSKHFQSRSNKNVLNQEMLFKILQFIFPDSATSGSDSEISDLETPLDDEGHSDNSLKDLLRTFKSAPPNSLTWRLALAMCHVNHSLGAFCAVANLWQEFVMEMRYRWDNNYLLPCLERETPNMNLCLMHQKLQMLNYCIERKIANERKQGQGRGSFGSGDASDDDDDDESDDEEEFFDCDDVSLAKPADADASGQSPGEKAHKPEGRLKKFGKIRLLNANVPLYIPVTQAPSPMTEDMLAEHADVLLQLGSNPEGAAIRARMQSACLLSDMEAFKAANPGAVLADFVRWYSPRDWIEDEVVDPDTGKSVAKGHLSPRMEVPGNTWLEVWESARPVPVHRQKRLFDETKEAEKVLHFLASLTPVDLVSHLMPVLFHSAVLELAKRADADPEMSSLLTHIIQKASRTVNAPESATEEVLDLIYQAEVKVAQIDSLMDKFLPPLSSDNASPVSKSPPHREVGSGGRPPTLASPKSDREGIKKFVHDLLFWPEVVVPGASRGHVGKVIRTMFAEAQKQACSTPSEEDLELTDSPRRQRMLTPLDESSNVEFPPPVGREFILRATLPRPALYSMSCPQRLYCALTDDEFRLAGAFSEDNTFQ